MCNAASCDTTQLTFESMLTDPLIRLVMKSDGVSMAQMVDVLLTAREALVRREIALYQAAAE